MNNMKNTQEPFKSEKWLYYQDVKPTNIYVEPDEKTKKNIEEFRKFIDEKIKKDNNK